MRITSCSPKRIVVALASLFLLTQLAQPALAVDLPKKQFVYKADSRKLPEVLQDLASTLQVPLVVAEGVDGTVNGKFDLTAPSFLDLMSSAYGLTWYFDGTVLFVYPARANQSKVLFLRDFSADRIERLLQSLRLGDKRYPLRYDAKEKTLVVSGPPRHLELVDSMVDAIAQRGQEEGRRVVKVFPLRYAAANDQTIGGATVKGMVSMLNEVYGNASKGTNSPAANTNATELAAMSPLGGVLGIGAESLATNGRYGERTDKPFENAASAFSLNSPKRPGSDQPGSRTATNISLVPLDDDRPVFTSDDANNSVIVMGLPHRMSVYGDLIKQLDVASDLIELEAMIIDVRHDDAASIGVNWTAKGRTTEASVSGIPSLAAAAGSVFQLTTLSSDLSRQLLLQVNALQQQGRARVVARPRVVGMSNRLATMKDTRSASIRVAGNLSSSLYSIETGTEISVIPRKVLIDGTHAIKLALSIQDGSFDANTVDAIPIVKRTGISTEAYVGEGEGLLIGGISSESDSNTQSGLPGLSKIPLFGALFRTTEDQASRRERLFLITPRILTLARKVVRAEPVSYQPEQPSAFEQGSGVARIRATDGATNTFKSAKTK
ncbi:MAG: type III secretion system outer membrane ring subunit SctC [Pseudomonadota bacterium]